MNFSMANRTSDAEWRGDLETGAGSLKLGSGAFGGKYSFKSRFEDGPGMDAATFKRTAQSAKKECPVSKALAAVEISLVATLR
jgi:osmotically inducible protein OsmC